MLFQISSDHPRVFHMSDINEFRKRAFCLFMWDSSNPGFVSFTGPRDRFIESYDPRESTVFTKFLITGSSPSKTVYR